MKTKRISFNRVVILCISFLFLMTSAFVGLKTIVANAMTSAKIELSIYSSYDGDSSSSSTDNLGHAWLVIENGMGLSYDFYNTVIYENETFSIGTWGNQIDPDTGEVACAAWLNLEAYRQRGTDNTASLTITITSAQLATVSEMCISLNKWNYISNCAYFASKIWNAVAPSDMQVSAYSFPTYYPKTLKNSIQKISGYQTNRSFDYNDYTGYCTDSNTFKEVEASLIKTKDSSSSSSIGETMLMDDPFTSFPAEVTTEEELIALCYESLQHNQEGGKDAEY